MTIVVLLCAKDRHPILLELDPRGQRAMRRHNAALRSAGFSPLQPEQAMTFATTISRSTHSAINEQIMKSVLFFLFALAASLMQPAPALAQSYDIDWFTLDGGGGTSSGDNCSVTGTIGQPGAYATSDDGYAVAGGFWSAAVADPPRLTIARNPLTGDVYIEWPDPSAGFNLQGNVDATDPSGWSNVSAVPSIVGPNKRVTVAAPQGQRFYRLRDSSTP